MRQTPLSSAVKWWRNNRQVAKWKRNGCPAPPPQCIKYQVIRDYAARFGTRILIETGTYLGEAIDACRTSFDQIYSIELAEILYRDAVKKFNRWKHITIVHGDSGKVLPRVLEKVDQPALFWLDGHYCGYPESGTALGDTVSPILAELSVIFAHRVKGHVLLIDDARLFTGDNGYPLLSEVKDIVAAHDSRASFEVENDIIRVPLTK